MKILEAGRIAPSIENIQPWHFHIVKNAEKKKQLMQTSCYGNFVEGASVFIVVTCNRSVAAASTITLWNPVEMEYSCVTAMHSMMLAAASMDIGSCWVSLHRGAVHAILELKDHQMIVGGLMLGHMKEGEENASREHQRHPIETMYTLYD